MPEHNKNKADQKNQPQNQPHIQPKKCCGDSNEQSADKATAVKAESKHDNAAKAQQEPAIAAKAQLKR